MNQTNSTSPDSRPWALVTGASAGIGAEFCRQLAQRGYNIVMLARRQDRMNELGETLAADFNVEWRAFSVDLADKTASTELAQHLKDENLDIEFLVNNAGYGLPGHFTQPDWADHERFIQVMMTSVCDLTWRLLPGMQARKKGYIINVASLAGLVPNSAGHTLYGASKAFLIRFSESLAIENAPLGVHVSALCPGFTYSEFHDVTGTRELVSKMPSWMWMKAEPVVDYGIRSVTRPTPRIVAIPGKANRAVERLMRWLPKPLAHRMSRRSAKHYRSAPKDS